ncbi:MAG: MgtC/SapB family protein [Acidobacteria bacterium]|nr:MgtC/SapB family protein [Acidobacteriota bacterium]
MDLILVEQLGISLGLGLIVGFQREWGSSHVAGIRSFALITLLGTVCAKLGILQSGWILPFGLIAVTALVIAGGFAKISSGEIGPGITTSVSALVMYTIGALVVYHIPVAIILGGTVALLLYGKEHLHSLVHSVSRDEFRAIFQLILIALVILPILPNRAYGPYNVLNPFHIWLMVVLIVGISLGGYVISRVLGTGKGALVSGIIGGIISSTATTAGFSRKSREEGVSIPLSAFVILAASTVVFFRVALEMGIAAPQILPTVLPQLLSMAAITGFICGIFYILHLRKVKAETPAETKDPANMKMAVVFGLLYAVVLFAVAAAIDEAGGSGMYIIAGLSGLTDMDAITLSTAQLLKQQRIGIDMGWKMILIGALANMIFKLAIVGVLGHRRLLRLLAVYFGIIILGGILLIAFWPAVS